MPDTTRVFLVTKSIGRRDLVVRSASELRYVARWLTRGAHGMEMYRSKPCATKAEAIELAHKYFARKTGWVDTTDTPLGFFRPEPSAKHGP